MKRATVIASGGVCAAAATALMYLASLLPTMKLALCAIAGVLLCYIVIKHGPAAAFVSYAATSALAFLVLPAKECAVLYAALFGVYPIFKSLFERLKSRLAEWALKLAYAAAVMLAFYFALTSVIPLFGRFADRLYFFAPLFIAAFVAYDVAFSGVIGFMRGRLKL